jgi:choline-glycine betaine transporter
MTVAWVARFSLSCSYLALPSVNTCNLELGPDNAKSEFSTFSWIGILFFAGLDSVMLYWGVEDSKFNAH